MNKLTQTELGALLQKMVAQRTKTPLPEVLLDLPLMSFGLGSVDMVGMLGELESSIGRSLDPRLVWEYPTIRLLAQHLASEAPGDEAHQITPAENLRPTSQNLESHEPVAVVGIGVHLPGGITSAAALWNYLKAGGDAVGSVPVDRWDGADLMGDALIPGSLLTDQGGFIEEADSFDSDFFRISPREAERMDPQQRLLIQTAWHALEDAGIPAQSVTGTDVGVILGLSNSDFGRSLQRSDMDAHSATGSAPSIAANRLSYLWDLHGPSMIVDTACSSSLVAVHEAARLVADGTVPLALAGGVNLVLTPEVNAAFTKMTVLSPSGRCRPFDAEADGIVRSDGVVVLVLKPASRALADGDRVYCVIRGGAVNQDGRTNGLTAPSPQAQVRVLQDAYHNAGIDPAAVDYVEAHGTGTLLGDPIEANALAQVFRRSDANRPLRIGSVKSNFGHTEACAGALGAAKAALMLHHKTWVPTVHFKRPNPHIDFNRLGLAVVAEDDDAPGPRTVGVSAFGFGGTNAHLVLQAGSEVDDPDTSTTHPSSVAVAVSGSTAQELRRAAESLADFVATAPDPDLRSIAVASGTRRDLHEHRAVVVGATADEVIDGLRAVATDGERLTVVTGRVITPGDGPVFVFGGQGDRYWPVNEDLLACEPFAQFIVEAQEILGSLQPDFPQLSDLMRSPADDDRLADPGIGQPTMSILQIGLSRMWQSWGVEPTAVVGHSLGEVAAAHIAGALDVTQAIEVALRRGQTIRPAIGNGAMAIIGLPSDDVSTDIARLGLDRLWVAGENGPYSTVLSGAVDQVLQFMTDCENRNVFARRIIESFSYASHSPLMKQAASELADELVFLRPNHTVIPMFSTVTGAKIPGSQLRAEYWARNLVSPVKFDGVISDLVTSGIKSFLELSAKPGLIGPILDRFAAEDVEGEALPTLRKEPGGLSSALLSAGELFCFGHQLDWHALLNAPRTHADLPLRKWAGHRYPLVARQAPDSAAHPILRALSRPADQPGTWLWSSRLDAATCTYLVDHVVSGDRLLPAAVLIDAALCAGRLALGRADLALIELQVLEPTLVPDAASDDTIQLRLRAEDYEAHVDIYTRPGIDEGEAWVRVASGRLVPCNDAFALENEDELLEARVACPHELSPDDLYETLASKGIVYGEAFRGVGAAWYGHSKAVITLRPQLELVRDAARHLIHPVILDSCLHSVGVALAGSDERNATYLPSGFARIRLSSAAPVEWACARLTPDGSDAIVARIDLFDEDGIAVGVVEGARFVRAVDDTSLLSDALYVYDFADPRPPLPDTVAHGTWLHITAGEPAEKALGEALHKAGATVVAVAPTELGETVRAHRPYGVLHTVGLAEAAGDTSATLLSHPLGLLDVTHTLVAEEVGLERILVVTRGVHGPGSTVTSIASGTLWGFGRTLAIEHPELHVTMLDLGDASAEAAADATVRLASTSPSGSEWMATEAGPVRGRMRRAAMADGNRWRRIPRMRLVTDNATLLAETPGILDSLCLTAVARRSPGPGEVEVQVVSAGLNFSDVLKALDQYPGIGTGVNPLGAECSGLVTRVGEGVTRVQPGDCVLALGHNAMSEYLTTPQSHVVRLPENIDLIAAGGIPIAFLTAVYGLEYLARLRSGESILVHSATGGVGTAALQVARRSDAQIFATAGTPEKRALLRAQGIRHVFDSRSLEFVKEIQAATDGHGIDVVLNSLAGKALSGGVSLLAPGGRFLEIGKRDIYADHSLSMLLLQRNRSFLALDLEQVIEESPDLLAELFAQVAAGLESGEFAPAETTTFNLGEADDAFSLMAQAEHTGKIVLLPDPAVDPVAVRADAPLMPGARIITGGLGALGLRTADLLVSRGATHLILMGRNAPSQAAAERVAAWQDAGVRVDVAAVDVADADAISDYIAGLPPVVGVYHAAGVLADCMIMNMDEEAVATVVRPKALGAWNLHRATVGHPVAEFVLFSSATGQLGSPGQANYAAANAALDALAHYRTAIGLPALSINWGPWAREGLATKSGATLGALGVKDIEPEDGVAALEALLMTSFEQVCVLPLSETLVRERTDMGVLPTLLTDLVASSGTQGIADKGLRSKFAALPAGQPRRSALQQYLREQVALVLRQDPELIDPQTPLTNMGFDSLMSLELRRRIEHSTGAKLPTTTVWRFPTVDALVPFIAKCLDLDLDHKIIH